MLFFLLPFLFGLEASYCVRFVDLVLEFGLCAWVGVVGFGRWNAGDGGKIYQLLVAF